MVVVSNLTSVSRTFYHQGLRKAITGPADFFVDEVLSFQRGTLLSRYTRLVLAFSISGLIHHCGEVSSGIPQAERGQMTYFTMQAMGIMIEDAVIALYDRSSIVKLPRNLEFALGYVWVLAWLVWITPTWFYAGLRHFDPVDDTFLFLVFKKVLDR